jgi:sulfate adenylyltransferase (ADP) / ATP adenylyltransferase
LTFFATEHATDRSCFNCTIMSSSKATESASLHLYEQALNRFDHLVKQSEILYRPYQTMKHPSKTFPAAFQLAPHLGYKPVLAVDAPERHSNHAESNPFANPDPAFVLPFESTTHTVMLNKYCVYRPQLLLVTKTYRPQYEALDDSDIRATWSLFSELEAGPGHNGGSNFKHVQVTPPSMLAFYNCGAEAGSSQGHKHVQVMPKPKSRELGFKLFPDLVGPEYEGNICDALPGVPHKHFILRLPEGANADDAVEAHGKLLARMREVIISRERWRSPDGKSDLPHNVLLTKDWVCIIPRQHSRLDHSSITNAMGMVGVFWITHPAQIEDYTRIWGPLDAHMAAIGYPV